MRGGRTKSFVRKERELLPEPSFWIYSDIRSQALTKSAHILGWRLVKTNLKYLKQKKNKSSNPATSPKKIPPRVDPKSLEEMSMQKWQYIHSAVLVFHISVSLSLSGGDVAAAADMALERTANGIWLDLMMMMVDGLGGRILRWLNRRFRPRCSSLKVVQARKYWAAFHYKTTIM